MEVWLIHLILFSATFITGIIFINLSSFNQKRLKYLLSFSGAFLFAFTVLHFIPDLYVNFKWHIGLFVLAGFFLQILLEFLSGGIDHGHIHLSDKSPLKVSALIGLFIHALLEATPLAAHNHAHHNHAHSHSGDFLLLGLILHKIPVAVVLGTLLQHHLKNKVKSSMVLFTFALMAPVGLLIADYFELIFEIQDELMAIVVGIFLYISTTILFEINENHRFNLYKVFSIIIGFITAIAVSF